MKYFGGKSKIAKQIARFINRYSNQYSLYVEPFCGACNVATHVKIKNKILNDKHPYLIAMWKALQEGWTPPENVSEEEYYNIKDNMDTFPHLAGFVGFTCSFAGKWWGGYARVGNRNYNFAQQGKNSVLSKISKLKNVEFLNKDFSELSFTNALIYCDPPYKNTTPYNKNLLGTFDYDKFLQWVKEQSKHNLVIVSEYKRNAPKDAKIVFELHDKTGVRDKNDKTITTQEILFTYNDIEVNPEFFPYPTLF